MEHISFSASWPQILTYGFLCFSIISLWISKKLPLARLWVYLFILSVAFAVISGTLTLFGCTITIAFAFFSYSYSNTNYSLVYRIPSGLIILLSSILLTLHLVPGFNNLMLWDKVILSEGAIPYTSYFNFDQSIVSIFILGFGLKLINKKEDWVKLLKRLPLMMLPIFVVILLLSLLFSFVRFDPKLPEGLWLWSIINLLSVSTNEEAIFRGFIQKHLRQWLKKYPYGNWIAILLAASMFAALHYAGGIKYVILAGVTGIGYGWVYERTQRIEASIITHFLLNLIHILLFTYPALASAFEA